MSNDPAREYRVLSAWTAIASAFRALAAAQRACDKRTAARAALPAGSSRARVTTANARWARACEQRDLCEKALRDLGVDLDVALKAVMP